MIISQKNNPELYKQLVLARKAVVLEAALRFYEINTWIAEQQKQCAHDELELAELKKNLTDNKTLNKLFYEKEKTILERNRLIEKRMEAVTASLNKYKTQLLIFNSLNNKGNAIQSMYANIRQLEVVLKQAECKLSLEKVTKALNHEYEVAWQRSQKWYLGGNILLSSIAIAGYISGIIVNPWFFLLIAVAIIAKIVSHYTLCAEYDRIEENRAVVAQKELEQIFHRGEAVIATMQASQSKTLDSIGVNGRRAKSPQGVDATEEELHKVLS